VTEIAFVLCWNPTTANAFTQALKLSKNINREGVQTRVAESEVNFPPPIFPKFPIPTFIKLRIPTP